MSVSTLSERLRAAVRATTEEAGRFKKLAQESGVPEASWKSWWYRRQRPTAEMIEAVCQAAPQFALWIATGISDEDTGHQAPQNLYYPGKLQRGELMPSEQNATVEYLKGCLLAAEMLQELQGKKATLEETMHEEEERIGLGRWIHEAVEKPSKKEVVKILQTLERQQRLHREETLFRLRTYNADGDQIIDRQRQMEKKFIDEMGVSDD